MKTHRKENFPKPVLALPELKSHQVRGFYGVLNMEEIWKDIPGYEGCYRVSSVGRVRSLDRLVRNSGGGYICKGVFLRPQNRGGYLLVGLYKSGKSKSISIHVLISMSFLGHKRGIVGGLVVDHINNIKTDNRLENLQLITSRENASKDRIQGGSKYRGVNWYKYTRKWCAKIRINGKRIHLGYFHKEIDASNAYQNRLKEIK